MPTRMRWHGARWLLAMVAVVLYPIGATQALTAPRRVAQSVRQAFTVVGNGTGLTGITEKQAQSILRGERTLWDSRLPVVVVLPGQRAPFAEALARELTGMTRSAMQRFWLALVFQGRASPPVFHDSVDETVGFVRRTPGAIALIPAGQGGELRELLIPWK